MKLIRALAEALVLIALLLLGGTMVSSHQPLPRPTYTAAQFAPYEPPPGPMQTAGAMDVLPEHSTSPVLPYSPDATPWPTHKPKPKLAGGPYKPWRTFNANVAAAREWLDIYLSRTQFRCIDVLWDRESRWRVHAENKSSGAYGIPQSLPGRKMAKFGDDWRDNALTQVRWGLSYIKSRYGNPCQALDHSYRTGWY